MQTFVVEERSVSEDEPPLVPMPHTTAGLQKNMSQSRQSLKFPL